MGIPFDATIIDKLQNEGSQIKQFNKYLTNQLQGLVWEIGKEDKLQQKRLLIIEQHITKKIILIIPAIIGCIVHAPYFLCIKHITKKINKQNHHYDSILAGLLILTYPFLLLVTCGVLYVIIKDMIVFLLIILLPFCAWSFVQLHQQIDD